MCRKATFHFPVRLSGVLLLAWALGAQTRADWRKVGGSAVEWMLAAPATGPVQQVWFSPGGGRLFARTASGRIFATSDFETWVPAAGANGPVPGVTASAARLPDPAARVVVSTADPLRMYALGEQLSRSEDGGRSWTNLTQFESASVVGSGQNSLAVSPQDPDELVLANQDGVWRSLDGGLSWAGLNQKLPNLPVRRILSVASGTTGTQIETDGFGALELPPGGSVWFPAEGIPPQDDTAVRQRYSAVLGTPISAIGAAGPTIYAGSSDGRIWVSFDGGQSFRLSRLDRTGAVERIYVDPVEPRVALAVSDGPGTRVLRTTSSGNLWDDLTANLPSGPLHAVTADRAAGAVYVAGDSGVFWMRADLEGDSLPSGGWTNLTDGLPGAPARDVRLDAAGVQLYVALDGYGVYATAAPHRARSLRIVNTADWSARAAAPGSLISVIGGRVDAAQGGGLNFPVLAVSDSESQLQVPFETAGPNVALALQTKAGPVTLGLPVQPVSPAIMIGHDGVPLLLDADSGLQIDARNPAHSNGRMQILATGLGRVRPDWPTGQQAPLQNPPSVIAPVTAYLDGQPLQVTRATLAPGYVGFYLIEVQLPPITNLGTSELYLSAGGQESNRVVLTLGP